MFCTFFCLSILSRSENRFQVCRLSTDATSTASPQTSRFRLGRSLQLGLRGWARRINRSRGWPDGSATSDVRYQSHALGSSQLEKKRKKEDFSLFLSNCLNFFLFLFDSSFLPSVKFLFKAIIDAVLNSTISFCIQFKSSSLRLFKKSSFIILPNFNS